MAQGDAAAERSAHVSRSTTAGTEGAGGARPSPFVELEGGRTVLRCVWERDQEINTLRRLLGLAPKDGG